MKLRAALPASLLVSVALATSVAQAEPVRLSALPDVPSIPAPVAEAAPQSIPASERVAGLYVVTPTETNYRSYLGLFDSAEAAAAYEKALAGQYASFAEQRYLPTSTCFTQVAAVPHASRNPSEWEGEQTPFVHVYRDYEPMRAVRAERWVDTPQGGRLETTVAWFDTKTGGMREISRSTSELLRVATPYTGLAIYAARSGPDSVEVVLRTELGPERDRELREAARSWSTTLSDVANRERTQLAARMSQVASQLQDLRAQLADRGSRQSQCGRLHVRLQVHTPQAVTPELQAKSEAALASSLAATESGDEAAMQAAQQLLEQAMAAKAAVPAPPRLETAAITTTAILGVQRDLTSHMATRLGFDRQAQAAQITGVRARGLSIQLGISKLTRDREPILSVSYRWNDKAQDISLLQFF